MLTIPQSVLKNRGVDANGTSAREEEHRIAKEGSFDNKSMSCLISE